MFYHDGGKLQYEVKVDKPDPVFANALQQAIGGVQGEIRVCLQYLFQAWGARGPTKYRDLLLETGTEEMAHIEMLATAVAMNLEGAPLEQDEAAKDPMIAAAMGGMNVQHVITTCMAAMPVDANGNPFDCSHVYASGNVAADMLANATAESTGRMLACQLWKMTDDKGMKDMLAYPRRARHHAPGTVDGRLGGARRAGQPPRSRTTSRRTSESEEFAYTFFTFGKDESVPVPEGAWSAGKSFDGRNEFRTERMEPRGKKPDLGKASPKASVQKGQEGIVDKVLGSL